MGERRRGRDLAEFATARLDYQLMLMDPGLRTSYAAAPLRADDTADVNVPGSHGGDARR